ncbi:MAG: ABC transporter ATP-binding protein [Bacilli bacterium]|nr:ABC transporter ATP-binding protein [Bacilli bacterium]
MIKISNLSKSFSDKKVLDNLNLEIEDGKIFGLVGINGAGKSTLLRLISGIYKADSGSVLIDDQEVYENEEVKSKIFFLPDEPYYSVNTTPLSLIELYQTFYDFNKEEYLKYLNHFNLPLKKSMHNFSKGMKRQVFISLALAIKPKYLLLDEAFDGLDPLARLTFKRAIIDMVSNNDTTIIISSHSLRELEDICDSYGLIDNKAISSSGDISSAIESLHKYQVAFEHVVVKEDFDIEFISYQQDRRIIKVVVKEDLEEFTEKIQKFNPLLIDEIKIDFEELFIIQVESRGYLNAKND